MAARDAGFRKEVIDCPLCSSNDFSVLLREERYMFWCLECHTGWTLSRNIEDVEDKEGRV